MSRKFSPVELIGRSDDRLAMKLFMFSQETEGDGRLKSAVRQLMTKVLGVTDLLDTTAVEPASGANEVAPNEIPKTFFQPTSCLTPRHPVNEPEKSSGRFINRYSAGVAGAAVLIIGGAVAGLTVDNDRGPAPQTGPVMVDPTQAYAPTIDAKPAPEGAGPSEYRLPDNR